MTRPTVLLVQRRMTHYRVPFFERLRDELATRGCELQLAYGEATAEEARKQDEGHIDWAVRLPTRYLAGGRVCWQPYGALLRRADVAVVTQENKLVYNLVAQFGQRRARVALWGHGANLQGRTGSLRERFKRRIARHADWWFGYTRHSLPIIQSTGFPAERITILDNAVDTRQLAAWRDSITAEEVKAQRRLLGLQGRHVGIYVGSLYREKRLDFLFEAADRIRQRVPDFELVIVGGGPLADEVQRDCARRPWACHVGPRTGRDKALLMSLAQVQLNPGLVGLGVLDSFVMGVPLITTDCRLHSPEIAYLDSGVNGLITADRLDEYVAATCQLLSDPDRLATMSRACLQSAGRYTVENMACNFADGVVECLRKPPLR